MFLKESSVVAKLCPSCGEGNHKRKTSLLCRKNPKSPNFVEDPPSIEYLPKKSLLCALNQTKNNDLVKAKQLKELKASTFDFRNEINNIVHYNT